MNLKNRQGKKLVATVSVPDGSYKLAAVIVVHGFKGFRSQRHIKGISRALAKKGIVAIRPDLTRNPGDSYLDFSDMTYGQELSDLVAAMKVLAKNMQIDILLQLEQKSKIWK